MQPLKLNKIVIVTRGVVMKKVSLFYSTVLLLLLINPCFSQDKTHMKMNVAVLNFDALGLSESEVGAITDRFRSELVRTNRFIVIEREKMQAIFSEIGFQMTGCTSTECAVEAGKILNTQKIIIGKIGKVGRTYTTVISLIDIETGQIQFSSSRDFRGKIENVLPILKEIAIEIAYPTPPMPISSFPLYLTGIVAIGSLGYGTYAYIQSENSYDDYKNALIVQDANKYKDETEKYDKHTLISGVIGGVAVVSFLTYRYFYIKSKTHQLVAVYPYYNDKYSYGLCLNITF